MSFVLIDALILHLSRSSAYWICRINRPLSCMRKNSNNLNYCSVEKWFKMQIYFYISAHIRLYCYHFTQFLVPYPLALVSLPQTHKTWCRIWHCQCQNCPVWQTDGRDACWTSYYGLSTPHLQQHLKHTCRYNEILKRHCSPEPYQMGELWGAVNSLSWAACTRNMDVQCRILCKFSARYSQTSHISHCQQAMNCLLPFPSLNLLYLSNIVLYGMSLVAHQV